MSEIRCAEESFLKNFPSKEKSLQSVRLKDCQKNGAVIYRRILKYGNNNKA